MTTASPEVKEENNEAIVTPYTVSGIVDYNKLVEKFGCEKMTPEIIEKIEKITKKPAHHWIRRGLFFAQRDLDVFLDHVAKDQPFYLYTGRGPSSEALHLGHLIPFIFTKYLQDVFDCPLVIQLTDDEKFLWKDITIEQAQAFARENIKDIIAVGFNPKKTFIFTDYGYISRLYPVATTIQKCVTGSTAKAIFGVTDSDNIGKFSFSAIQAAPAFPITFPHLFPNLKVNTNAKKSCKVEAKTDPKSIRCLIPCAIDQDPYFRLTRDVSQKLGCNKPSLLMSKFFPALQGFETKMSASDMNSAIYVTDSANTIKKKINKYAFSGGQATIEEQRTKGANVDVDVSVAYLNFFMENDEEFETIKQQYKEGKLLSGEIKSILINLLADIVCKHQQRRKEITDDVIQQFMRYD